ncbi:MAG: OB-fold nucleic acid binding domain-containing protein [Actinomycetaceae bacterium]|nr:OB-fold nucleic acid binding domain-containing protein [Arcanobacterium sp.]MDD7504338.1 OB-fold nucleic acid binding domain-containing protein [Actinomycetaceae bacterium]MDY6142977.1 OB-fold nucleic acid binding domain-containing protein [Arcanobacterium sp.]
MTRWVNVEGVVTAVTYPGYGDDPVVRVILQVGRASLTLVFQSRRDISAIEIGQRIRVRGNVVANGGVPLLYNPEYEIVGIDDEYR